MHLVLSKLKRETLMTASNDSLMCRICHSTPTRRSLRDATLRRVLFSFIYALDLVIERRRVRRGQGWFFPIWCGEETQTSGAVLKKQSPPSVLPRNPLHVIDKQPALITTHRRFLLDETTGKHCSSPHYVLGCIETHYGNDIKNQSYAIQEVMFRFFVCSIKAASHVFVS